MGIRNFWFEPGSFFLSIFMLGSAAVCIFDHWIGRGPKNFVSISVIVSFVLMAVFLFWLSLRLGRAQKAKRQSSVGKENQQDHQQNRKI